MNRIVSASDAKLIAQSDWFDVDYKERMQDGIQMAGAGNR